MSILYVLGSHLGVCFLLIRPVVRKKSDYCFEKFSSTSHTEQSHVKNLKYFLGVNRKTTNITVMSELSGRYPICFSVILAMLKYCHRLEGQQEGLLFDAYVCNKEFYFSKINTWQGRIQGGGGGAHPARSPPPPKIGKNMIFWRKIVIFHTKYPQNFRASLRSAQFF